MKKFIQITKKTLAFILTLSLMILSTGLFTVPVEAAGEGYSDLFRIYSLTGIDKDYKVNGTALMYGSANAGADSNYVIVIKVHSTRKDYLMDIITEREFEKITKNCLSVSQMDTATYNAFMLENGASDEYLFLEDKPPIVNSILKAAANGKTSIKIKDTLAISPDALKLASQKCGSNFSIICDTMEGKKVDVRLTVYPSTTTKGVITTAYADDYLAEYFEEKFGNKFAIVDFVQEGSFGTTVKVTAKVDLKNLNKDNLRFYSFNRVTNKYAEVENTNYSVDSKGYLVFYTDRGNTMLITDKKLK